MGLSEYVRVRRRGAHGLLLRAIRTCAGQHTGLPAIDVWAIRTGTGITGASTSIITAEDIARSPERRFRTCCRAKRASRPGARPAVRTAPAPRSTCAASASTASSNTLFLLNGRRLNDIDLLGIDLSTIPRDSIEHIEITRGNSGAVLYGGGAVGGVINIITKTGVGLPPTARVEGGFGSFNQREINGSAAVSHGPFAVSVFANGVDSDGYRVNSARAPAQCGRRPALYRRAKATPG